MFNPFGRFAPVVGLVGIVALIAGFVLVASVLARGDDETSRVETGHAENHDPGGDHSVADQVTVDDLVGDTEAGVARFEDLEVARAEGYEPLGGEQARDERTGAPRPLHFVNRRYFEDGDTLAPERPESLIYIEGGGGMDLIGAMYVAPRGEGPVDGGIQWHTHDDLCIGLNEAGTAAISPKTGGCPEDSLPVGDLEMLHVWLFDHPGGPLAHGLEIENFAGLS